MGHRVVHGLTTSVPVRIDAELMATIRQASALAPLHNPPNAAGIEAAMASFPDVPQVAVFDTAWHAGMPAAAAAYALPRSLCEAQRIRRYGFHGTSYAYLSSRLAQRLDRPLQELSAVLCHLGAGSSVACMRRGRGVDTSMGLTPLEGLVMATRAGDLDPAIVAHLLRQGAGMEQVDELLNKKSGLAGLAGTADMREIVDRAGEGDEDCRLALDVYVHRLRKYLGAYVLQLDGKLDAIVFSAGIGENSAVVRELACKNLSWLGIEIDQEKNLAAVYGVEADISTPASTVRVWVIPTDEEVSIAQQTLDVLQS
ncbi:acetate kinase [Helicosporidium sp. ATCC 50920]|nr:acetate kinase [Helicosporidium sp. ATCC 50920]|eukprot:KDD75494.1 acetate kinase [Helicosporidium sp. ATCC 50920]